LLAALAEHNSLYQAVGYHIERQSDHYTQDTHEVADHRRHLSSAPKNGKCRRVQGAHRALSLAGSIRPTFLKPKISDNQVPLF
jgi:hypothetical protein